METFQEIVSKNNWILPDFNSRSLLNIINTVLEHFGAENPYPAVDPQLSAQIKNTNKVVLFLADGFGWNDFMNAGQKQPIFKSAVANGKVEKMTSVFPSTTAAAITTLTSGLPPKEHGLLEWYLYMQELNSIIQSLAYEMVSTPYQYTRPLPNSPEILFNVQSVFSRLEEVEVPSYAIMPNGLLDTTYNVRAMEGAHLLGYDSIEELFELLKVVLENTPKCYVYAYWSNIDGCNHANGPGSSSTEYEVSVLGEAFEKFLENLASQAKKDTGLLLTADHGHLKVRPQDTHYLNSIKALKGMYTIKNDIPILPTGNARDLFLHVQDEYFIKALDLLEKELGDCSEVLPITFEIVDALFGSGPEHPEFASRLGDILILPKEDELVWHTYQGNKFSFLGHHGGLHPDEMYIPLVISRLSELF